LEKITYDNLVRTGPGTIAGRYMRLFWQPVFVSRELPKGRAKPIRIMSEDFTLFRGDSGKVYLTQYRCAHRGTPLSVGWVEGDCIRCRYHGWKFDGTGQCVEQPDEPKNPKKTGPGIRMRGISGVVRHNFVNEEVFLPR
jgi:5,5'-dehydrodivanillate O-demethylase